MKKQKFTKQQAHVGAPALVNSFEVPASHNAEVSVVFGAKDIAIHGWDGSEWTHLYRWDGEDLQFTFENSYQKYHLRSFTGSAEEVRVSFFSADRYQGSTPSLAGVDRGVKLYDIDEVPIYTASDVNKMLTVMSNGSLRWLLANESFIIPEEGGQEGGQEGGEEGGGENNTPTYSELTPSGDAAVVDGQIQTNGGYFSALWSDFVSYTGDTPDNSDFTVAFWWKHGETPVAGVTPTFGLFSGRDDSLNEGMNYLIMDHPTSGVRLQTNFGPSYFANRTDLISEDPNVEHPWNHFVFTRTAATTKTYWNGALVANHGANFPWVPNSASAGFRLGASDESGSNSSSNTLFEDFEIRDGEAMSASDITALYDAGRVSQQSGGGSADPQVGEIVGLEEDSNLTLHGNAQLIDGVLHFDGTPGTYASLPHSLDYDRQNGDLTISVWFKANSLPNNWNAGLVSKMGNGWSGWITQVSTMSGMTEGGLQTSTWVNGGSNANSRASLPEGIALGQWHHAAYVMVQTGQYKMYFNGQLVKSYNPSYRNTSTTGDLRIGGWQNGIYHGYFDGQIEGVKIEKTARTASDILEEYNSGAPSANPGLEEDAGLTLHGNAQLIDGVLTLDGANGTYASLPHSTDYDRESGDLTVDFWFNADSLPAADNNYILMSKPTGAHDWNGWVIAYSTQRQDQGNSGPLMTAGGIGVFASNQGTGGAVAQPNNFRATVAGGVPANTWHHVAVTMPASGDYTIYLNGQSIGSWLPPYKNDSTNTELLFGATKGFPVGSFVKFFPGELDQVSINKSILTASEIYDLHDAGR